jgi:hypothetical protein
LKTNTLLYYVLHNVSNEARWKTQWLLQKGSCLETQFIVRIYFLTNLITSISMKPPTCRTQPCKEYELASTYCEWQWCVTCYHYSHCLFVNDKTTK